MNAAVRRPLARLAPYAVAVGAFLWWGGLASSNTRWELGRTGLFVHVSVLLFVALFLLDRVATLGRLVRQAPGDPRWTRRAG